MKLQEQHLLVQLVAIIFNHRIAQQFAANAIDRLTKLRSVLPIHLHLNHSADGYLLQALEAKIAHRVADGSPLRIKHVLFWCDEYGNFHDKGNLQITALRRAPSREKRKKEGSNFPRGAANDNENQSSESKNT